MVFLYFIFSMFLPRGQERREACFAVPSHLFSFSTLLNQVNAVSLTICLDFLTSAAPLFPGMLVEKKPCRRQNGETPRRPELGMKEEGAPMSNFIPYCRFFRS